MIDDTIVAPATGPVRAAIAVIRVSGPRASALLEAVIGELPAPRQARFAAFRDPADGSLIDHGLALHFPAPASFTGEDSAEFQLHGSPACVKRLVAALTAQPHVRLAEAGEFTRRALENGKIDLIGAEALADLIDSETEQQRQSALARADGRFGGRIRDLREELLALRSLVEAEIDFSDEADIPASLAGEIGGRLQALAGTLDDMVRRSLSTEIMREGFQVVLGGPVNAGKSTLMNALAGRDVAIVSDIPGTTRDILEVKLDLGGYPVVLRDVAGLRDSDDVIEAIGMARARRALQDADLVLWLDPSDMSGQPPAVPAGKLIRLRSKSDLRNEPDRPEGLDVSGKSGAGIPRLLAEIQQRAAALWRPDAAAWQVNARQLACLERARDLLRKIPPDLGAPIEFIAEDLREVAHALSELLGDMGVEDVLGAVFSRFCIGK